MGKKKKHIQTERERLLHEEAVRKRKELAEAKRLKRIKEAWWLIGVACIILAVSLGFTIWTVARMYNFETNYITVRGTVSNYNVNHGSIGSNSSRNTYSLVITYVFNDHEYKFSDTTSYHKRPTDMIGTTTEIYVNPKYPENAKKVTTADDPSIVSAIIFPFCAIVYTLGMLLLLQEKGNSFAKRLLLIWIPIFLWCVTSILLFWIGLPNDGFSAVFARVEGAIGYAVVGGIPLLAALIDVIISNRK
ncbi:MAG: DUF3592 domain-containing protein [Clostridiales bacterium]|nr:DUF3592 domain-containing protein [Clostridiales bacterium]